MKWIGQDIYDFVAKFRNDVFLEDISTGTIASGGNLGLDSNNKIVKASSTSHDEVTLAGTPDYITISGQEITRGQIDLANDVTGVLPSANMDADTAHLSGTQTFSGVKTFSAQTIFDGNQTLTPGDGAVIHQDTIVLTDGNTSASGTAALCTLVNIEGARLQATNSSVTTTIAASLYIKEAPSAGTNQTITNAYALYVDDGLVKFDGALTVGGTITGDVTGDLTGQADTVATIAGLAPNTATTQATQAAITTCANLATVGTITTGVWNGTAIAHAYIGADAIDGDNLADDAVDSEHYTDGSIDTAHIADDQVTFAKAIGVTPNVYGSTIKVLPSDFMANDDGGVTKTIQFVDENSSGLKPGNAGTELLAFVAVPEGMKVTLVDVYASSAFAVDVIELDIHQIVTDISAASIGTGNANTQINVTDTNSTATNFFMIQVTTTATSSRVFGALVTIAAQ